MSRWMKPTVLQVYSFSMSMPLIDFVLNYIMYDERVFKDIKVWLISFPFIFILGFLSWSGHVAIGNAVRKRYPGLEQSRLRIILLALVIVPFMSLSIVLIFLLYNQLSVLGYQLSESDLKAGLLVGFSVNLIFETLFEADYALGKYKESVEDKNSIRELAVQQEFDSLKSQVNPHFLFNCFNTLSSLITEDRQKAESFLNELSKVYRYLLRNNEDGLSTVENEVKFIQSYYRLLRTRHGEAVQLNMEIDKRYNPYLLPSLTLQLLVENVVKHNALSKNYPVVIDIFTTAGNKLVVNNNLRHRVVKIKGTRVGLDNIRAKYKLLSKEGFQVMSDERNFTVILPLIWSNAIENKTLNANKIKPQ
ncbi:histidine kinase [Agriterribacter sp.]|uniref:sensor histidine kinase n=1 Tax=Agriterribacter sp. TaxID=2821509 RepID=UPI002C6A7C12|nr:histidine kinase [Agriterribacter sp.]HTN06980.1 histidine kinase [Agriterribacter sp.]